MLTHQWSAGIRRNLAAAVAFADSIGSLQRGEGFMFPSAARLDASRHMLIMAWFTPALPDVGCRDGSVVQVVAQRCAYHVGECVLAGSLTEEAQYGVRQCGVCDGCG